MRRAPFQLVITIAVVSTICSSSAPQASALELLASWANFGTGTTTQPWTTSQAGSNGAINYFSDLSMSFQNINAQDHGATGSLPLGQFPNFADLQFTANGNPATTGGQWIQLNFTKAPAFADYRFEITGIYHRFWNNANESGGSESEVHFYSTTGNFATSTTRQMNTSGTGILLTKPPNQLATPPGTATSPASYAFNQFNEIGEAASSYQIRMAPDRMSGNHPHWAMESLTQAGGFSFGSGQVLVVVGNVFAPVPEPSTYILGAIGVTTIGLIDARRRRARKTARTA
jgi:hypothetical protein